jgi:hypothetical protein
MASMRWSVVVEGKQHLVEFRAGYIDIHISAEASGKAIDRVLVDEEVVWWWISSAWRGPKKIPLTIDGEPAMLVRKGFWDWRHFCFDTYNYELFFKGEKIEGSELQPPRLNILPP